MILNRDKFYRKYLSRIIVTRRRITPDSSGLFTPGSLVLVFGVKILVCCLVQMCALWQCSRRCDIGLLKINCEISEFYVVVSFARFGKKSATADRKQAWRWVIESCEIWTKNTRNRLMSKCDDVVYFLEGIKSRFCLQTLDYSKSVSRAALA